MKNNLLIILFLFFGLFVKAQSPEIRLYDYNAVEISSIIEYWFWAAGVTVEGSGFEANSELELIITDPNDGKRYFTAITDENGNFNGWVNSKTNLSILGIHTISAIDAKANTADAEIEVIKDPAETLNVTISPAEITLSEFEQSGVDLTVTGLNPEALLKINIGYPSGKGKEVMPASDLYADVKGSFSLHIDPTTPIGASFATSGIPSIEGVWNISVFDYSEGEDSWGRCEFRMVRDIESIDSYCEVSLSGVALPITSVNFGQISTNTSSDDANAYIDNTSVITNVTIGESYTMRLSAVSYASYSANTLTAFIDWNHNGTLDDEGEVYSIGSVLGSTGIDDQYVIADITVPEIAVSGSTRMRILNAYSPSSTSMFWPTGACGEYGDGQIQDFTLNVSTSTGIGDVSKISFDVSPNPNNGNMIVETQTMGVIKIFDISGNALYSKDVNSGKTDINVFLKSGIYLLNFKSKTQSVTKRILIK
ncbi:T9SS type A sorting domain-containing protein [Carboxylicivirga linearis]|uniref:T9SS type A sorting domain-containing protein n=1 Tax=Carboxylicivirga linearis TaxID=1628157 RepID=A0ABS5K142_9BACT|nr:T9SS type A sorting domain-containing protein [Carboxylicivirga linearis]MBS2100887.1 T9SS type A sorting domain-containing protein [Carboxylicivirga linearis]